ncbi:hypothetical protein T552_01943 [Pneumocystis carinii B80]|uniref:Mob1/phocein family protein n=1 Tax=Pneumocystis carinii (strain B80) TaxID=1408658 RepID=A0A0W4ZI84_PNEC8|nr:hypothetical protein T552_01943 [Pneumocystis carinii B80]KTW28082.1 hypothetical protein T552_01943 [Pneumocystis carinii B80]
MSSFMHSKASIRPLSEDSTCINVISPLNEPIKSSMDEPLDIKTLVDAPFKRQRLRPGMKKEDIPIMPLIESDFEGLYSLEEYLDGLLSNETLHPMPLKRTKEIAEPPKGVDPWIWVYELIKRFTVDLNMLVVGMLEDSCSPEKCPEMRANEWQYLCACHSPPQECVPIDYILHTLDNTSALLCSDKYFPSKTSIPLSSTRHFSSIMRRLYRIFNHAWYKHYEIFWKVENEISLYRRFMAVSEYYHFKYEHPDMVNEAYSKEIEDGYQDQEKVDHYNSQAHNDHNYKTPNNSYEYDKENKGNKNITAP